MNQPTQPQTKLNEDNRHTELLAPSEDQTRITRSEAAPTSAKEHPLKFVLQVLEDATTHSELNLKVNPEYQERYRQLLTAHWLLTSEPLDVIKGVRELMEEVVQAALKEKK